MLTVLQCDFYFAGPWEEEMAQQFSALARDIANEEGLIWKVWTENKNEHRSGGLYLFADEINAERYTQKHVARLKQFGATDINARLFQVNGTLSTITRAPV